MVRYAKKKNIIVAISSNLSLLTKGKAKESIQSGLDYLIVSLDGAFEETYYLYHGRAYINFCSIPWEEVVIRYSGTVLSCCVDIGQKHRIESLSQNGNYLGFRKLWNNIHYRNFRRQVADINGSDICFNCAQRDNNCKDQIQFNEKV